MAAHSAAHRTHRKSGRHRAPSEPRIARYTWLGAGAVTLGIGAAMANGAGVAGADTGADDGSTSSATQSTPAAQTPNDGGSQPNKGPDTKPVSTVGSGRDDAVDDEAVEPSPGGSSAGGSTSPSSSAGNPPVTSVAASGGNVKTVIKHGDKIANLLRANAKKSDKLAPAEATAATEDVKSVEDAAVTAPPSTSPSTVPGSPSKPLALVTDVEPDPVIDLVEEPAPKAGAAPVPWSLNPFRPMPPEPAPNDMPGQIWDVEKAILKAFDPAPFLKPFVREGFEAGFRVSQMIPFVNAVIPAINIVNQLPNLASPDPTVVRTAAQSIVNNLIVTLHPVSVLYYAYDEVADLVNLEYEAQVLKEWFYSTTWNLLDPFALLHNRGDSGLPLSPSTPTSPSQTAPEVILAASTSAIAATTDDPGSNPFRANDPDPTAMPKSLLEVRNIIMSALPNEVDPIFREAFEFVYRTSQMVPFVNAVVPITQVIPAIIQAIGGDRAGAQIAINQLLLTTGPLSILFYGYDQIADLLNVEEAAFAAKELLYISLWDGLDPTGLLHNVGDSGLRR